jgi:hypothetical protein
MYVTVMQAPGGKKGLQNPHCDRLSLAVDCHDMRVVPQALPSFPRILCDLRGPTDKALASDKCPVIVIGGAATSQAPSAFAGSPPRPSSIRRMIAGALSVVP